ncbi:hypothetical protein HK098_000566 [Nowakowskiella sp. JEL0407]|nr:hypothetical protein HK098_000566 [Nowakowskiella sp. JEL0407]
MYIRLTNFKQNHRLYTSSVHGKQLQGDFIAKASDLGSACGYLQFSNCDKSREALMPRNANQSDAQNQISMLSMDCWPTPKARDPVIQNAHEDAQYYPCGLIANSMFTDDISGLSCIGNIRLNDTEISSLLAELNVSNQEVSLPVFRSGPYSSPSIIPKPAQKSIIHHCEPNIDVYQFSEKNLSWREKLSKFGNSKWNITEERRNNITRKLIPPPMWRRTWPIWKDGYNETNLPDIANWERLHVWMDPAGFPTFRKLWGKNEQEDLNPGTYEMQIRDSKKANY